MTPDFPTHPNCVRATLVEHFVDTAVTTGQSFIRVKMDGFNTFSNISDYPLALVSSLFFIYPLRKDDVVWVFSPSESSMSLVLYSVETYGGVDFKFPPDLITYLKSQQTYPTDGSIVLFSNGFPPTNIPATVSVTYISPDFYIIAMTGATQFASGNCFTVYFPNRVLSYTTDTGSYEIKTGKFMLETSSTITFKTSSTITFNASGQITIDTSDAIAVSAGGDVTINSGTGGTVTLNGNLQVSK